MKGKIFIILAIMLVSGMWLVRCGGRDKSEQS